MNKNTKALLLARFDAKIEPQLPGLIFFRPWYETVSGVPEQGRWHALSIEAAEQLVGYLKAQAAQARSTLAEHPRH